MNINDDDIKKKMIIQNAQIKTLLNRVEMLEGVVTSLTEIPTQMNEYNRVMKEYEKISNDVISKFVLSLYDELDIWVVLKCISGIIGIVFFIFFLIYFISSCIREILLFNMETYLMVLKK